MKNIALTFTLIYSLLFFAGCSTDFDMYADYKDITIVYGMADIENDTTWVKITKAYTGPGDALLFAQNPDSSNYTYKLDVSMVGKKNGSNLEPIIFDTLTIHNKEITDTIISAEGDTLILNPFYSPNQLMYYAVGEINKDAVYTLNINRSGKTLTAVSDIVAPFSVSKPVNRITFSNSATGSDGKIEWNSAKNGKRYEVSLRFYYSELGPDYSDTLHKSVSWRVGVVSSSGLAGGEKLAETYSGLAFYNLLTKELEPIPNVERWAGTVDITIACGSQVLATYLNINAGGGSMLEEVPIYSNIVGGSGIFASRYTTGKNIRISSVTERTLINDYDFGFRYKTK